MARLAVPLASLALLGSLALGASYSGSAEPSALAPAASTTSGLIRGATGTVDVGSTGADGAFNPTGANYVVDLATQGTYDPQRWMVIFHYTSVNVPYGTTVTFTNHPSRAPVVWLVQNDVTINGWISLNGTNGHNGNFPSRFAEPGPGGFRGGRGSLNGLLDDASAAPGPGGGFRNLADTDNQGGNAGHVTIGNTGIGVGGLGGPVYGDRTVAQLVGGSGGAGGRYVGEQGRVSGGGSGGGAILIAANGTIRVTTNGVIIANGGAGGGTASGSAYGGNGSGGSIKLVADVVLLDRGPNVGAQLQCLGYNSNASKGRIRIESNNQDGLAVPTDPAADIQTGGVTGANVLPNLSTFPQLIVTSIGGVPAPLDPRANIGLSATVPDVDLSAAGLATIEIEGRNIPLASTIYLRVTQASGGNAVEYAVNGTPIGSDSLWTRVIDVDLTNGYTALQARAVLP